MRIQNRLLNKGDEGRIREKKLLWLAAFYWVNNLYNEFLEFENDKFDIFKVFNSIV